MWCNCWFKEQGFFASFIFSWKLVAAWSKLWKQYAEQCSEFANVWKFERPYHGLSHAWKNTRPFRRCNRHSSLHMQTCLAFFHACEKAFSQWTNSEHCRILRSAYRYHVLRRASTRGYSYSERTLFESTITPC